MLVEVKFEVDVNPHLRPGRVIGHYCLCNVTKAEQRGQNCSALNSEMLIALFCFWSPAILMPNHGAEKEWGPFPD